MRLWITTALVALLAALLWLTGGQIRAEAPPATTTLDETTALRYETYDAAGEAATAGSYAFLPDSDGATSAVATYEGLRDGTAKHLLIHKTDAQGTSRAPLYDAIASGAFFEWRKADDCWVRYRVTEVQPDPPGAAPRKLLAVEWTTYAFTGCSGPIAASAAAVIEWGALPDLGGVNLSSPVVHGPYQLVPEGWRGVVQEPRTYPSPGYSVANPTYTQDLAAARRLPYWREPALPAGWTFSWASAGDVSGPTYGYWAVFATERGGHGVTISGYYADYRGHPEDASWLNARGAFETRTIAGRPARVAYSPPGPSHDDLFPLTVWIYDPSTEAEYAVLGKAKSLRGSNVDAVIAIARSLFEGANEATAATQGAAGPGESLAPLTEPMPLIEWWADGRPTSPPLHLKLHSSRELCTAGTLTEISWEISGGVAPYSLSVEGEAVDASADNVRVNCGALTEAEAGDAELAAKTVSAVVTDSRGVQRQAALAVARARALPAPQNISYAPELGIARTFWDWVEGAGSQSPEILAGGGNTQRDGYLVRYRAAGAGTWIYAEFRIPGRAGAWEIAGPSVHEMQVAAVRHSIEAETPAALRWSETLRYVYATAPENAAVTATATTVTVSWDAQPLAGAGSIILEGPRGVKVGRFVEPTEPGRHSYTFSDVPPETSYEVVIDKSTPTGRASGRVSMSVRTSAAPPGRAALPVGPQNVRAHATLDSITVTWEAPHAGASDRYNVEVTEEATNALVDIHWINGPDRSATLRSVFQRIRPDTKYRVRVTHAGIVTSTVELVVTTPAAGLFTSLATPRPLFEWWADGRPTSLPLHLKLRSSRDLCTAGTLTEVSWEISGGVAPYDLSIEGAAVDLDADNVRVNCGALTEAEAGDADAALTAKTVSATVTDSRGAQRQAALEVARAKALPAPTNVRYYAHVVDVGVHWDEVDGAGSQSPTTVDPDTQNRLTVTGVIRTRANRDGAAWTYHTVNRPHPEWTLDPPADLRVLSVAAVRHPLELETPTALNWSKELVYTAMKLAQNVTIAATHDTVTVSWDRQPYAAGQGVWVWLFAANEVHSGRSGYRYMPLWEEQGVSGRHEVTFAHLPSDTDLAVLIVMGGDAFNARSTTHPVRTQAPPAGWAAPPSGPQNLRYASANGVLTVYWDEPYTAAGTLWRITITNPTTRATYRTESYGPSWTWPRYVGRRPNTEYRITIEHTDFGRGTAEITVLTPPARPAGQAESLAPLARPEPLFEWWADGRPTSPPLDLKLQSSRELCTAGTLTEISWQIGGGVAPYTLSIEGAAVDVDAENVRVNCGALTEAETGDAEADLAAKTVSAVVTDSRGVQRQAALDIARARALPAPQNVGYDAHVAEVGVYWDEVNGAGAQSPTTVDPDTQNRLTVTGMIRTRANQDGAGWTYHTVNRSHPYWTLDPPVEFRVLSVAAVRHPLELETPAALNWSDEIVYTAMKLAQNVTIAATHDTMTVSWDRQPYAAGRAVWVLLYTANDVYVGRNGSRLVRLREEEGVSGRHEVAFAQLPPDTDLAVLIVMGGDAINARSTTHPVRTQTPPAGWAAPPSGPQNLRYASANDTLTVYWDEPYSAEGTSWSITITNPTTGTTYRTGSYSSSWTWPQSVSRLPNKEYHITIAHTDLGRGAAEITVRTPPDPNERNTPMDDVSPDKMRLRSFFPIWPALIDERYAMTDDPFQRRGVAAVVG